MSVRRVMALGASLVCSVEYTKWPVSADADRDIGRLAVADFAHHDDVRILAHDVPQALRRTSARSADSRGSG